MFQQTLENDYSMAGADHNLFDRWEVPTPAPWSSQIPALWAEEE